MPFKKGQGGRKPGSKNIVQKDAKAHIMEVFDYLQKNPKTSLRGVAKEKPEWFYDSIYRAIIPREMKADVKHDLSENLMELAVQVAQELRVNGGNSDK